MPRFLQCFVGATLFTLSLWAGSEGVSLTPRRERNLVAFAQVLGLIRFEHPCDQSLQADWNRLAARGVEAVECAESVEDLARRLDFFFGPWAPSARFLPPGGRLECPIVHGGTVYLVRWDSRGLGLREREFVVFGERPPRGWADPQSRDGIRLDEGLQVLVPSVCFADKGKHTLPRVQTRTPKASTSLRARSLGTLILAWSVIQHFHPAVSTRQEDWRQALQRSLQLVSMDPTSFEASMREMLGILQDDSLHLDTPPMQRKSIHSKKRRYMSMANCLLPDGYSLSWMQYTDRYE